MREETENSQARKQNNKPQRTYSCIVFIPITDKGKDEKKKRKGRENRVEKTPRACTGQTNKTIKNNMIVKTLRQTCSHATMQRKARIPWKKTEE